MEICGRHWGFWRFEWKYCHEHEDQIDPYKVWEQDIGHLQVLVHDKIKYWKFCDSHENQSAWEKN